MNFEADNSILSWWRAWLISARPRTLVVTAVSLIASWTYLIDLIENTFQPSLILIRMVIVSVACFILQIACNLTNEYYDFIRGTDDEDRVGPKRMLQKGIITKEAMIWGIRGLYLIFSVIILVLAYTITWTVLPLAGLSMGVAIFYTAGKYPLSYYGLGEFFAFWFFGPIFTLIIIYTTSYGYISFDPFLTFNLGLGPGFFSLTLISINNIRDREHDRIKKKQTLIQLFKPKTSLWLLAISYHLSLLVPIWLSWKYEKAGYPLLFIFLIPSLIFNFKIFKLKKEEFNSQIEFTTRFFLLYSIAFFFIWNLDRGIY